MKKVTGIISLMVCCAAIIFCVILLADMYSQLKDYYEEVRIEQPLANDELLQKLYNEYNLSQRYTYEHFKSDMQYEVVQRRFYDKYGLSKTGTFKEFQSALNYFIMHLGNAVPISERIDLTKKYMLISGLCIIPWALGIYYTIATRFGAIVPVVLQHLEKENNFIRKQIEKRELLVKLEDLEKQ